MDKDIELVLNSIDKAARGDSKFNPEGFNYINLDRDLMRDHDQLLRIKKAKEYCAEIGKPVKISLLANEWCWGGCPIMPEHYHYNMERGEDDPQYFNDSISRFI